MSATDQPLNIVFLGLSITSSWGNGHATTYRALLRELARAGHRATFLERNVPWYANNRDMPSLEGCEIHLYESTEELKRLHANRVRTADAVIVGSYVPEGVGVGDWVLNTARGVRAFYDIDTPVTLAKLRAGDTEYISPDLVTRYDLYLSFTGGPILSHLEKDLGSPAARALYCSVDTERYQPRRREASYALGYLGTYSDDRQPALERLLIEPARMLSHARFIVGGPSYPHHVDWPRNVERVEHVKPNEHPAFYCSQRFTLNVTRRDMIRAGWSPSVRLFEAAACGVPIISDVWEGIDELFEPNQEILLARSQRDVVAYLSDIDERQRAEIGQRARRRVIAEHTAKRRAAQLVSYLRSAIEECSTDPRRAVV